MRLTVEVPYGDIDAMGHLNNVAYLRYLEFARQKYWLAMVGSSDFREVDFVVARAEIDYRSSVEMGEVLEIEIHVSRIGVSSFDFSYAVRATTQGVAGTAATTQGVAGTAATGRLVAEAKTTQVSYDWETRSKKPLSDERRLQIEAFEIRDR
jgi:YbgC/YbaW family acyl-CoA thioester hydrolase